MKGTFRIGVRNLAPQCFSSLDVAVSLPARLPEQLFGKRSNAQHTVSMENNGREVSRLSHA